MIAGVIMYFLIGVWYDYDSSWHATFHAVKFAASSLERYTVCHVCCYIRCWSLPHSYTDVISCGVYVPSSWFPCYMVWSHR